MYYVQFKNSGHTASKQKLSVLGLQDDVKSFHLDETLLQLRIINPPAIIGDRIKNKSFYKSSKS